MQSNKHIPKFNNQFGTVKFLTECWWLFCKRIYNFWGTMCIKLQLKVTCILVWWIMSPTVKILFFLFCSIGMCRMQWFLAILRSFFHSSLLCTFSCHSSPPTILPSSLTSPCHLLGLPLNLVVPKFIYNTLLGIIFSSILCTCPNKRNLFNLTDSILVGFFNTCINFLIVFSNVLNKNTNNTHTHS